MASTLARPNDPPRAITEEEEDSIDKLQESFARAAELQEKRDLEHLAYQDLLMLSEDMESGSDADDMERTERVEAANAKLSTWNSPSSVKWQAPEDTATGVTVQSSEGTFYTFGATATGGTFGQGHKAPSRPSDKVKALLERMRRGEVGVGEVVKWAEAENEAVILKLVTSLRHLLARAEHTSRQRSNVARAIAALRQVGPFAEVTLEAVVKKMDHVVDLLGLDSLQVLVGGTQSMAMRSSGAGAPTIEMPFHWEDTKSIASHVHHRFVQPAHRLLVLNFQLLSGDAVGRASVCSCKALIFHAAPADERYSKHVDGLAQQMLVWVFTTAKDLNKGCRRLRTHAVTGSRAVRCASAQLVPIADPDAVPSESSDSGSGKEMDTEEEEEDLNHMDPLDKIAYLKKRWPKSMGVVNMQRLNGPNFTHEEFELMELVAGVLLHLVLGAAEVHRQRYSQTVHAVGGTNKLSRMHAGMQALRCHLHLESTMRSMEEEVTLAGGAMCAQLLMLSSHKRQHFWSPYAGGKEQPFPMQQVFSGEVVLSGEVLKKHGNDCKPGAMDHHLLCHTVVQKLPNTALANFTAVEETSLCNELDLHAPSTTCMDVFEHRLARTAMRTSGRSASSPPQKPIHHRAGEAASDDKPLIAVMQVLNKLPTREIVDDQPLEPSPQFTKADVDRITKVVKRMKGVLAAAMVQAELEESSEQQQRVVDESRVLLPAVSALISPPEGDTSKAPTTIAAENALSRATAVPRVGAVALPPGGLLNELCTQAQFLANAERCQIFLYESNWRKLHLYTGDGLTKWTMKVQRNDKVLPTKLVEQVVQENCVRTALETTLDPAQATDQSSEEEHIVCLPLHTGLLNKPRSSGADAGAPAGALNRVVGAMHLARRTCAFESWEVERLVVLRDMGLLALRNSTLIAQRKGATSKDRHHLQWLFDF